MDDTRVVDLNSFKGIIESNTDIIAILPWNGKEMFCKLHIPNSTQLESCGNYSTVSLGDGKDSNFSFEDLMVLRNTQEKIFKLVLVKPTYEEILDTVLGLDYYKSLQAQVRETEILINSLTDESQKEQYKEELDALKILLGFIMPDDFTESLTTFVYQIKNSDVWRLSKDMLLTAAALADKSGSRPSDFLEGLFTEKHKKDIDQQAMYILHEHREDAKSVGRKSVRKWMRSDM